MPRRQRADDVPFELLSTDEVAALLHMSKSRLKQWRMEGIGPEWRRAGRRILYRRIDVERWFELQAGS